MSRYKIQQAYYINHAVDTQFIKHQYLKLNQFGMENSLLTISSPNDLSEWLFLVYTDIFNWRDSNYIY